MGMEQCKAGQCPGYGRICWTNSYWDCDRCGTQRIFGSHICPKDHNHSIESDTKPMSIAKRMKFLDAILTALDDVHEAKQELQERDAAYTGYSPSWALASWREVEEKAKQRLMTALDEYVNYCISERPESNSH